MKLGVKFGVKLYTYCTVNDYGNKIKTFLMILSLMLFITIISCIFVFQLHRFRQATKNIIQPIKDDSELNRT